MGESLQLNRLKVLPAKYIPQISLWMNGLQLGTDNIVIEANWSYKRNFNGCSICDVLELGRTHGYLVEHDPIHMCVSLSGFEATTYYSRSLWCFLTTDFVFASERGYKT